MLTLYQLSYVPTMNWFNDYPDFRERLQDFFDIQTITADLTRHRNASIVSLNLFRINRELFEISDYDIWVIQKNHASHERQQPQTQSRSGNP
jgi:hypothetical protein